MKTLILISLFLLVSCGESPLFNHGSEGDLGSAAVLGDSNGLRFKKTNFLFSVNWEEGPYLGRSRFLMRTWDKNSGSINGPYQDLPKDLHIFLWMPGMGHGSSPVKIQKINDGEYEVTDVQFIMGGKWEIKFQLRDSGQVFDETVISLSI